MRRTLRAHGFILFCAFALVGAVACSFAVDFEPEGKPCDETEACLAGYVCENNICVAEKPPEDAGLPVEDAGIEPEDAGLEPEDDAGLEPEDDAGLEPEDDAGFDEDAGI